MARSPTRPVETEWRAPADFPAGWAGFVDPAAQNSGQRTRKTHCRTRAGSHSQFRHRRLIRLTSLRRLVGEPPDAAKRSSLESRSMLVTMRRAAGEMHARIARMIQRSRNPVGYTRRRRAAWVGRGNAAIVARRTTSRTVEAEILLLTPGPGKRNGPRCSGRARSQPRRLTTARSAIGTQYPDRFLTTHGPSGLTSTTRSEATPAGSKPFDSSRRMAWSRGLSPGAASTAS